MDYVDHYKKDAEEFDYFAERYGATKDDERRLREYILSRLPSSSKLVLDAGCGSGWASRALIPEGKRIVSIDISMKNVATALKNSPSENHMGVICDTMHLPFKEHSFDAIIASEIIEHTVEPESFAASLFKAVKKGGVLLISTPYKEKILYTLCIHCNKKTPMNAHLHSFDENILLKIGRAIGSGNTKFNTFGNKFLIFGRTYVFHKFLPFTGWKLIDTLFNKILGRPVHILMEYYK